MTLAILWDSPHSIPIQGDLTLFLVRCLDGIYQIWGVLDNGSVSSLDKPIQLDAKDLPTEIFNLEDI